MLLRLTLGFLLSFVLHFSAYAEDIVPVCKIEISSGLRIQKDAVISMSGLKIGEKPESTDKIIDNLYRSGMFLSVRAVVDGCVVHLEIKENPLVARVFFRGNKQFKSEDLKKEIHLNFGAPYRADTIEQDIRVILASYHSIGYYAASIHPYLEYVSSGVVNILLDIDEGEVVQIGKIQFQGNKFFSSFDLKGMMLSREQRWYYFLSHADRFNKERIFYDQTLLENAYKNAGFADVHISQPLMVLSDDRLSVYLTYHVDEGVRYQFGDYKFTTSLQGVEEKQLNTIFSSLHGYFSHDKLESIKEKLMVRFHSLGYSFINIDYELQLDTEKRTVSVLFKAEEGLKAVVRRISIHGNAKTKDSVIRHLIPFAENTPYNPDQLRKALNQIQAADFTESVTYKTHKNKELGGTSVDIDFDVKEKSTGYIRVAGGYSTQNGLLAEFALGEKNFLGSGLNVGAMFAPSSRFTTYGLNIADPNFMGRDLYGTAGIFRNYDNRWDESSYNFKSYGATTGLGYKLSDNLYNNLSFAYVHENISDVSPDASYFIKSMKGEYDILKLGTSLTYDRRINPNMPIGGYIVTVSSEYAGLMGDVNYFRLMGTGTYYFKPVSIIKPFVRGTVKRIWGLSGQETRISDRFTLGGPTGFRGFKAAGVGPRDLSTSAEDALGGNLFLLGTVQANVPLKFFSNMGIEGEVFSDFGTLKGAPAQAAGNTDNGAIRVTSGVGLSWVSPIGRIEIAYIFPIKTESYDEVDKVYFAFGNTF